MTTLPSNVPSPEATSFGWSVDMGLVRTDMGNGNARQRQRYDTLPQQYSFRWFLTRSQHNELMWFFKNYGDAFFSIDLPSMDGVAVLTTVSARLIGNLTATYRQTDSWEVAGIFEVLTGNPPDPDLVAGFLLMETGDNLLLEDDGRIPLESGNALI